MGQRKPLLFRPRLSGQEKAEAAKRQSAHNKWYAVAQAWASKVQEVTADANLSPDEIAESGEVSRYLVERWIIGADLPGPENFRSVIRLLGLYDYSNTLVYDLSNLYGQVVEAALAVRCPTLSDQQREDIAAILRKAVCTQQGTELVKYLPAYIRQLLQFHCPQLLQEPRRPPDLTNESQAAEAAAIEIRSGPDAERHGSPAQEIPATVLPEDPASTPREDLVPPPRREPKDSPHKASGPPPLHADPEGQDGRPDPSTAQTEEELVAALREFWRWAGGYPSRKLEEWSGKAFSHATVSALLSEKTTVKRPPLRLEYVRGLIRACGGDQEEVFRWIKAWRLVMRNAAEQRLPDRSGEVLKLPDRRTGSG